MLILYVLANKSSILICTVYVKAIFSYVFVYFKNTVNLFIHIARIPIGDSPRVHPNILKCPLAYARGCVILRSHILILLLLILLIFHHIHS